MKILHIFSNWKWTGPAEHALNLAASLKQAGHSVTFACAAPPDSATDSIAANASRLGLLPETCFRLNKHFNIRDNLSDISAMRRFIKDGGYDIIHTHLPNDHFLAGMALRSGFIRTPIIRTCYDGDNTPLGLRPRFCLSRLTDGLITISDLTRKQILNRCSISANKVWKLDVPVDLERFDPDRVKNCRHEYGLSDETAVGGIVARVQTHRRFEILLSALQIVIREFPGFRFMIIGRGTHIEEIAIKPSQKMGIRPNLIFTGYRKEKFVETLACLDFKVFLVPGSDGSCRAVREAMAMRIPVIAAKRGMLPEIVENGKHGLVIDDSPSRLARSMLFLIEHPDIREEMAVNAFNRARKCFDRNQYREEVEKIYMEVS